MNLNIYIIFGLIILQASLIVDGYEYCKKDDNLCGPKNHIACITKTELIGKNNRDLGHLVGIYYNTQILSDALVTYHNRLRNNVSAGITYVGRARCNRAARMREMTWDFELAYTAQLHVSKCVAGYDCHNTKRFPSSGQNMLVIPLYKNVTSIQDILDAVKDWVREKNHVEPDNLTSGIDRYAFGGIQNFTQLINECNTHLGCALAKCAVGNEINILLTCNYSCKNVPDVPIYETGPIDCSYWKNGMPSKRYPFLCAPLDL